MGEIKSVKVDNWGVFFLQKLQNFFNKTDYCDLTLQFRDNSQLKVHRLVLSACTDYFNVLEQTCDVVDDALIMPNELQADVVVPIVNFMYTGTLEFELKMYGKLLRTAKEMNMTVLLKLLEAHRRTMENVNRAQRPPSPKAIRRRPITAQTSPNIIAGPYQNQTQQQARRVLTTTNAAGGALNIVQRRVVQTKSAGTNAPAPLQIQYRQQIGSTSVVRTSTLRPNQQSSLQSYIKNEPEEFESVRHQTQQSTSPFEQLRKGYNNNKRPAISTFLSPPAKKPNLEDVKEFAEQQRMRKQIAAEYGDDQEFEGMMDDDIHNDDDDDEVGLPPSSSSMVTVSGTPTAQSNQQSVRAESATGATATITFKQEQEGQPPTIIVKDSSGSKMNHAKIISEVLRQYPHLAKGNKNIKLKIMPNATGQAQRIVIKKEPEDDGGSIQQAHTLKQPIQKAGISSHQISAKNERFIAQNQQSIGKTTVAASSQKPNAAAPTTSAAAENAQQKRRIDSKTMHALIALGAENTTGPWLCLRCGVNGRPISIPSYRGFRRHLINTHKETIDPALCEHCGWRSHNNRELHFHMQIEHKIKTTLYTFPECVICAESFLDTEALNQHILDSHPSANKQQCIYCNKIFIKEMQLYTHMKLYHKHQAMEDGIIDASDDEYAMPPETDPVAEEEEDEEEIQEHKNTKIKILSDISLPVAKSTDALSAAAEVQTKFVTPDGNEMILTEEQRKEIMAQLNQEHNNGGVVMVLHDPIFSAEDAGVESKDQEGEPEASATTTADVASEEELDDSQIYSELGGEDPESNKKSEAEKDDNLEWAENLISEHELAEHDDDDHNATKKVEEEKEKKADLNDKLKALTTDWSEDENDEEDDDVHVAEATENIETLSTPNEEGTEFEAEDKVNSDVISPEESEKEKISIGSSSTDAELKKVVDEAIDDAHEVNSENTTESSRVEAEPPQRHDEDDELDLAMQTLHAEEPTHQKPSKDGTNKIDVDEDEEVEEVRKEASRRSSQEQQQQEKENEPNDTAVEESSDQDKSHNKTLLEELMSTSAEDPEKHSGEITRKIKEEKEETSVNRSANDEDMEFLSASLTDAEEFTSLEKEPSSTATLPDAKSKQSLDLQEDNEGAKKSDKDIPATSSLEQSELAEKAKKLSSDWEDIDDDDDVEAVEDDEDE